MQNLTRSDSATSNSGRLMLFVLAGGCLFVLGLLAGITLFDIHGNHSGHPRPWEKYTSSGASAKRSLVNRWRHQTAPDRAEADTSRLRGNTNPHDMRGESQKNTGAKPETPRAVTIQDVLGDPEVPESWVHLDGSSFIESSHALDADELSVGAWLRLPAASSNINTIVSNREPGCQGKPSQYGFSFYVNEWDTSDRSLMLEWSDETGKGCKKAKAAAGIVPSDEWVHVAFAFRNPTAKTPGKLYLFVNGDLALSQSLNVGASRLLQGEAAIRIGSFSDGQYKLVGDIANVFIMKSIVTPNQLKFIISHGTDAHVLETAKAATERMLMFAALQTHDQSASATTVAADDLIHTVTLKYKHDSHKAAQTKFKQGAQMRKMEAPARHEPKQIDSQQQQHGLRPQRPRDEPVGPNSDHTTPPQRRPPPTTATNGNRWITAEMHLPEDMVTGTTADAAALAAGTFSDNVSTEDKAESDRLGQERAAAVKGAMQFIWQNYKSHAWGADELKPKSGTPNNNWGGMGMTLIDALDTLYIMGMQKEFKEGVNWIQERLSFDRSSSVSVFETCIRALGGLLSAYDLSTDEVLLHKAKELGNKLLPAFNTPSGIPLNSVNLRSGQGSNPSWTGSNSILSELGTMQVEFRYLARHTRTPNFAKKVENVIETLHKHPQPHGLYPIYISPTTGGPTNRQVTFGALGDSFYEYLLKTWIQGGKTEQMYRTMYDEAMNGLTDVLLQRTTPSNLLYVSDWNGQHNIHKMDHLVCFVPGMLALGAYTSEGTPGEANKWRDLQNAKALMYTCWQMYERMQTGIAPEYVEFRPGQDLTAAARAPFYILRPETAESLFILHQLTGNPIYREWGWKMFTAIDKYCKTTYGYGAYPDVRNTGRQPDDRMESFFLAETLKYLYLLQAPDHDISLEKYVFNTEAHPLRTFTEF